MFPRDANRVSFLRRKATKIYKRVERWADSLVSCTIIWFDKSDFRVRLELINELQQKLKKNINLLKEQDFDEIESYLSEKFDDILVTLKLFTTIIDSHPDLTNVWKLQHFRWIWKLRIEVEVLQII